MGVAYWVSWCFGIIAVLIGGGVLVLVKRFVKKATDRWDRKDREDKLLRFTVDSMVYAHEQQENGAGKLFTYNFREKLKELKENEKYLTIDE